MKRLGRYWNTTKHLRPVQLYGRVWFQLSRPRSNLRPAPPRRALCATPARFVWRKATLVAPDTLLLLGERGVIQRASDWNDPTHSQLWLYNAHYFDDLLADGADERRDWQLRLVDRWIAENPPARGMGWAPYPISLRLVNLIYWLQTTPALATPVVTESLAVQARYLARRLEHHLLGNHLIANAKALAFAGLYFEGPEADRWYETGMSLLTREFGEQVLIDGGHFELSPMYHNIILTDLLDLLNVHATYGRHAPDDWPPLAERMLDWAAAMTHPDGEISLFNDAAFDVAPRVDQLQDYAALLNIPFSLPAPSALTALTATGYARLTAGDAVLFADMARVGPDYLPAHAHADTLSFELSLGTRRIIVNGGTSRYGVDAERLRQRSTANHSTVMIDGQDSSEVWGGFRVARRANILRAQSGQSDARTWAVGHHDGYDRLPGRPRHKRRWELSRHGLTVTDTVTGSGTHALSILFHLAPDLHAEPAGGGVALLDRENGQTLAHVEGSGPASIDIGPSTWHPRFGEVIANQRLLIHITAPLPVEHVTRFTWDPA